MATMKTIGLDKLWDGSICQKGSRAEDGRTREWNGSAEFEFPLCSLSALTDPDAG